MATKEGKQWWNPYETSNKRHFVFQPSSAAEMLLCRNPTSTSFIDTFSQSGPLGSTVYKNDFCWKPVHNSESYCTGTASGQRRNNPHPSQSFMIRRLPREAAQGIDYVSFPWKCPRSEAVIRKALTAQYCSTYRCDFKGMPQGYDHAYYEGRRIAPLYNMHKVLHSVDTEMRDNCCKPKRKTGLFCNHSVNTDLKGPCHGIVVPTVVKRPVHTQHKGYDLTNYDMFYGKRVADVSGVLKSVLPHELQQLQNVLSEEEKKAVTTVLSKGAQPNNMEGVNKLPAVMSDSCTPKWISSWPGPH